jgi:hypothetical protein
LSNERVVEKRSEVVQVEFSDKSNQILNPNNHGSVRLGTRCRARALWRIYIKCS